MQDSTSSKKTHICEHCDKGFSHPNQLVRHLRVHTGEKPYQCEVCNKKFSQNSHLKQHLRTHTGDKPYECKECGKRFTHTGNLNKHLRMHADKKNSPNCQQRRKKTSQPTNLNGQVQEHADGELLKCEECGSTFSQSSRLQQHLQVHATGEETVHSEGSSEEEGDGGGGVRNQQAHETSGVAPMDHDPCARVSTGDSESREHINQEDFLSKDGGGVAVSSSNTGISLCDDNTSEKLEQNEMAILQVVNPTTAAAEQGSGEGDNSEKELGVSIVASLNGVLVTQLSAGTSPGSEVDQDVLSSLVTGANVDLEAYVKKHLCSLCGKEFTHPNHLTRHLRVHTGERPYRCEECGKRFSQSAHLKQHARTHTGDQPFQCQECGRKFSHSANLRQHMRIHSGKKPFQCQHCDMKFSRGFDLNRHIRVHTGERPFHCEECGKTFSQSAHLHQHLRIHSGEKPFACKDCGKTFSKSNGLRQHLRTHAGEKQVQCEEEGVIGMQGEHLLDQYHLNDSHLGFVMEPEPDHSQPLALTDDQGSVSLEVVTTQ